MNWHHTSVCWRSLHRQSHVKKIPGTHQMTSGAVWIPSNVWLTWMRGEINISRICLSSTDEKAFGASQLFRRCNSKAWHSWPELSSSESLTSVLGGADATRKCTSIISTVPSIQFQSFAHFPGAFKQRIHNVCVRRRSSDEEAANRNGGGVQIKIARELRQKRG